MRFARFTALGSLAVLMMVPAVAPAPEAAPPTGVKSVVVQCQPGWRATAVGQYGGVSFAVSCQNGRGNGRLTGTVGTAYGMRVGVESEIGAGDCAYSGDAATVEVSCLDVRISIR